MNVEEIRKEFPLLHQDVHDHPLAYLDNAATSQKPQCVIDKERRYYELDNANIHRGVHELSQRATDEYEKARENIRDWINAPRVEECIFVRGTTEAINLVAQTFGRQLQAGDEIVIGHSEHHSNIVPWQLLCKERGTVLRVIPLNDKGEWDLSSLDAVITDKCKLVSVGHVSNALGTINQVGPVIARAKAVGAATLLDGAQAVPHMKVDVQALGCDFYAFSAHKMYGPTGVGILWGRTELLEAMPPWQGGGEMINKVTFEETTYNEIPHKFEAGTPNIAGGIGFGAAIEFLRRVGIENIAAHEAELEAYCTAELSKIEGVRLIGTAAEKAGVVSFVIDGVHPHDVGTLVDRYGVAIRTGHHCAQPVMQHFDVPATCRASFACYNTRDEVDRLIVALKKTIELFA
ncbi:MAG: cysteine desulfurase [Thermoplasmatota archaeon]